MRRLFLFFALLILIMAITGSVFLGWSVITGPVSFSLLGLFLLLRWGIQILRSRQHHRETRQVYLPLLNAIHSLYPSSFTEKDIRYWYHRRLNAELWMQALLKNHPYLQQSEAWQAVVDATFRGIPLEKWQIAFPDANLEGDPAQFAKTLTAVGVPIYGITPEELAETLAGLAHQSVPFKQVALVLNDPPNEEARSFLRRWLAEHNLPGWFLTDLEIANKKAAMATAVTSVQAPLFINVDADTNATPNANFFTILAFVLFPKLHGLTSNVRIKNLGPVRGSMLQWLTYFRYDAVNNVERAARRWNETVLSGPWLAVRQESFLSFLDDWLNFSFAGKPVRPGDDRRITFELNRRRLATAYFGQVIVYTDCPENLKRWKSQQERWTLSYYVNMFDSFASGQAWQLTLWSLIDQVYGGFFSFFLLGAIGSILAQTIQLAQNNEPHARDLLIFYGLTIFAANFGRGAYAAIVNRDIRGFLLTGYVYLFGRYMVPIKIVKLFSLTDQRWQGRKGVT